MPSKRSRRSAQPAATPAVEIDGNDIGGVVTSRFGPEAGVWVIAETTELGTRFAKMAVTDEVGRYVIPDLPKANYRVWVRGYGLVDSPKVAAAPGQSLNLTAVVAPNLAAAAQYYPAIYWASMIRVPDKSRFPGTGADGNGIPVNFKTQDQWLNAVKTNGCGNCHQIGNYATRVIPPQLGHFDSSIEAWARRLQSGPAGRDMVRFVTQFMGPDGGHLAALADWTDRIKAGELPSATPPRPVGLERNIVVTVRDWSDPKHYLHDLTLTDKRKPTVNGYGLIYGAAELSTDNLPILDPVHNTKMVMKVPVKDPKYTPSSALSNQVLAPSPYWGMEQVWDTQVNAHNPMMDQDGRVYYTAQQRSPKDPPDYCKKDLPLRSAQLYPLAGTPDGFVQNSRQITVYDPATKKFSFIDTCFGTHHLNFAEDANNTLWLSNNTQGALAVVGWINTKLYWETGDAAKAQGWTPMIVDTNGNGKRDEGYNEPGKPADPTKDTRIPYAMYGISYSPLDGSIWGSNLEHPGYILRLAPGCQSGRDRARGNLPHPDAGLRHPRHGHRPQRRRVDAARLRPYRQLRPPPVQGPAQRAGRRAGQQVSGGLRLLPDPRTRLPGRLRRRGEPVLHLGRPARHLGPRRQHADRHRQPVGFAPCPRQRPRDRIARALSHGLLRQGARRPHRRSERRLEGPRPVGDLGQPHAGPYRGHRRARTRCAWRVAGNRIEPAGGELPAPAQSAGALTRNSLPRSLAGEGLRHASTGRPGVARPLSEVR